MYWRLSLVIACLSAVSCAASCSPASEKLLPWPTDSWPVSVPEEQAMDGDKLSDLDSEIRDGKYGNIDGMLIIRNGHVVYDRSYENDYDGLYADKEKTPGPYNYYNPEWHPYYKRGNLHSLQSVTKSITSALVGIAIRRKEIADIDIPILDFFQQYDVANVDERKKSVRFRDLLTMTAGFDWDEHSIPYEDPRNVAVQMERSEDWVKFVVDRPMAHEPGTFFAYSSGVSQMLSVIMKQSTGVTVDQYAEKHLFGPLGIRDYYWKRTPQGLLDTEGGLYLDPHDLAKIGYLYLNDGVWSGERVLPEGWVGDSMHRWVEDVAPDDDDNNRGYGYQWWLMPYEGEKESYFWAGRGYGGQLLYVFPEYQLITVFTGWNVYGTSTGIPMNVYFDAVLRAIK